MTPADSSEELPSAFVCFGVVIEEFDFVAAIASMKVSIGKAGGWRVCMQCIQALLPPSFFGSLLSHATSHP